MIRSFQIIGGFEVTNVMRHFVMSGYTTPQEMLNDLDFARQHVLQFVSKQDVDAFLDALNREKNQGNP